MARSMLLLLSLASLAYLSLADSRAKQNYADECANGLNQQINTELEASYIYMAMAAHFSHDLHAMPGFAKFFAKASDEEREHANKMIEYQNKRGGQAEFYRIRSPTKGNWTTGLGAMEHLLTLERKVNEDLLNLHKLCSSDPSMQDFLESNFLNEQVESIKKAADHISRLRRLHLSNAHLGEHIYDKELA